MTPLKKLDGRRIPSAIEEIRAFVCVRNERKRLRCFLDHYRGLGVSRFFFVDNLSDDGTVEYLVEQDDCHVFSAPGNYFKENVEPPSWTNALANAFGSGHWTLTIDADELFVFPHCDRILLRDFCRFLTQSGYEAVSGPMIDFYPDGPVAKANYRDGSHFLDCCPFFDPHPGWTIHMEGCPGWQMFGGVRERVFWQGKFKGQLPPCISKVPLVKWTRGMYYVVSMHRHSGATVSPLRAGLLHFKFLSGFTMSTSEQLRSNVSVIEKGLSEKAIYLSTLAVRPDLSLRNRNSVRYEGPSQLEAYGWMKSTSEYDGFVRSLTSKLGRRSS